MKRIVVVAILVCSCCRAWADVSLPAIFGDHMVLQRGVNLPIWGRARPGEKVTIQVADQQRSTTADSTGCWRLSVNPIDSPAPVQLTVRGENTITINDILIGDVWLCSGQSNMEWPLKSSKDGEKAIAGGDLPSIRLFIVEHQAAAAPKDDFVGHWVACSPQTVADFSGVAFFFGRERHEKLKCPIGLIQSAYGGTVAETWTDADYLRTDPILRPIIDRYESDLPRFAELQKEYEQKLAHWNVLAVQHDPGDAKFEEGWAREDFDDSGWKTMKLPGTWENTAGLTIDGAVWFRREITLPDSAAGKELTLNLGGIDDGDTTYFNGVRVGSIPASDGGSWLVQRRYSIPPNLVRAGKSVIAVRVFDIGGAGGMYGPAEKMSIGSISLAGEWKYAVELALEPKHDIPPAPIAPQGPDMPNSPANLFNGMIRPLAPLAIKGVIWYQGESNGDRGWQYRALLPALINSWRNAWAQGDFPFYVVQLPNIHPPTNVPAENSDWAELREAQLMTSRTLPNVGLVVTTDIGDANDIHPHNKSDVGHRLALLAEGVASPVYKSMEIAGDKIVIHFDHARGLHAREGELRGFAIAGGDRKFAWADARISDDSIVVSSPAVATPLEVRYNWADNPIGNLVNADDMPASPFRTDDWSRAWADPSGRIRYDRQCLTIDSQDTFVFSGAFHYFRCPKPLWRERLTRMKQAGLNTVETYVPWNYHEPTPPDDVNDFSKLTKFDELEAWLKMAEDEFGFNVILRPGPYICAEWDGGGLPQWLLKYRPENVETPYWLRSDEPTFLAWSRHWYQAVAKVAATHQLTHRPAGKTGIILWQIENEYDQCHQPQDVSFRQISALAHWSRELGIDVPLFTCITRDANYRADVFLRDNLLETQNTYPGFEMKWVRKPLESLVAYQPDKLRMFAELQGGFYSQIGAKPSSELGYDAAQINHITLLAMELGVTSMNYYMFFGGTNFGDRAAMGVETTYDYAAPICEPGGVGERWRAVAAIGQMLREHGPKLARAEPVELEVVRKAHDDVSIAARRAHDGSVYFFVRTEQRHGPREGQAVVRVKDGSQTVELSYALEPFGAKIFYDGRWLPDVSTVAMPTRPSAEQLPAPIEITHAKRKADLGPVDWRPIRSGQSLEDVGVFDSRYVFYRAALPVMPDESALLVSRSTGDSIVAQLGRALLKPEAAHDEETAFRLPQSTEQNVLILYENGGRSLALAGGLDHKKGVTQLRLVLASSLAIPIENWKMRFVDSANDRRETAAEFDDSHWESVAINEGSDTMQQRPYAVFRSAFDSPPMNGNGPVNLVISCVDDHGWIYLNGQKIGETHSFAQKHSFDVSKLLRPGKNVLAIVVYNEGGPGGLSQGVVLQPPPAQGASVALTHIATGSTGFLERWWEPSIDDSKWDQVQLGATPHDQPLLTWYRVHFKLPPTTSGVWAPWKIRLDATGNGFLYLNDKPLGRYWEIGPQREFFLPECWLNPDGDNLLTMCLRTTGQPPTLRGARLSVYADQAELRATDH